MARFVRELLLKIPAIRRQMRRLTDIEVAIQAQALRLGTLEDGIRRLDALEANRKTGLAIPAADSASALERQRLLEEITERDRDLRLLRVGHGATFEELAATGKVGGGTPYRFEELQGIRQSGGQGAPTVPPLVFIHVPKAGGTTLNNILMKNYRFRIDSYGENFFPRYYPDEFVSLVQEPIAEDTRRPVYFTGHIDLDNDLFRYMPVRYVAVTMLRDPVQRIVSHYRFHSTLQRSPLSAQIGNGALDVVDYFQRFRSTIPMQYEIFAPRKTGGVAVAEAGRVQEALENLESKVSHFGLQERYDAFVVVLRELLGIPDAFSQPLNKTPSDAAPVTDDQIDRLRDLMPDELDFYHGAIRLHERRMQNLAFDLESKLGMFAEAKQRYLALRDDGDQVRHAWFGSYA